MTTPHTPENHAEGGWEEKIIEAVYATYPKDIWPDPQETSHLKDANVAYIMREMAGAFAAISKQVHEATITSELEALTREILATLNMPLDMMRYNDILTIAKNHNLDVSDNG